ncbi:FecR domain-containing protein [Sphingosinicellaceae bacterium]|nr:FecR domain-containing protein [Sphingosinicellaceae bacterium]
MIREALTLEHLQSLPSGEAAALLLVRQDMADESDHGDDGDDHVFMPWLESDPANGAAWARACQLWEQVTPDAPELQSLRAAPAAPVAPRSRAPWRFAIAASVAVALVGGATFLARWPDGPTATQVAGAGVVPVMLATGRGERRSFALADASNVTLNTDTALRVVFSPGGDRRVELLHGQAVFAVAHDASRPFIVAVGERSVTALGTRFEVRADPGLMRVVLVEGSVAVRTGGPPIFLVPGQQLVARGDSPPVVSAADVSAVGDWQRGVVTFHDTPLSAAAAELNRYAATPLRVRDPKVAGYRVSGSFRTDDAARFARTVAEIYPVRVVAVGTDLEIVAAK